MSDDELIEAMHEALMDSMCAVLAVVRAHDAAECVEYEATTAYLKADAELAARDAKIEKLTAWISDLQSGMYVNCVYCGHRYGPGETTPVSMSDALKAHIAQCPEHPMSALRAENERLRADAERYRVARRKVCIVGDSFHVINLRPTYVAPDAAIEFDAAIDAAIARGKE